MTAFRYPFGAPVVARPPSADGERQVFVLGAYPSALHVTWHPPRPYARVLALPVSDESEPFWTGEDEDEQIAAWRSTVGFRESWGRVEPCGRFNGSSGIWVKERILRPLGVTRSRCWITDCLTTYRTSKGVAKRLADTYAPFADAHEAPAVELAPHPDENAIVEEALTTETARLRAELARATPEVIVTLGNAALRVLRSLARVLDDPGRGLVSDGGYGAACRVEVGSKVARWLPLAHPASPRRYQEAHDRWLSGLGGEGHSPS